MEAVLSIRKGPMGWDKYGVKADMGLVKFVSDPLAGYYSSTRDPNVWYDVKSDFEGKNKMVLTASRKFDVNEDI